MGSKIRKGGALSGGTAAIAQQVQTDSFQITDDASDNLGIYNAPSGGTEIVYIDSIGNVVLLEGNAFQGKDGSGAARTLASLNSNQIQIGDTSRGADIFNVMFYFGSTNKTTLSTAGILSKYGNITTAGLGAPAIYKAGAQTLYTNAAPTSLSYTPPATAGRYRLSASLNILTGGTLTFKVKITYTDAGGNARTPIPVFVADNSTSLVAGGPAANSTGRLSMVPWEFDIDNSGTAITIQDNAGTYTAGTYYWIPTLEQLA